MGNQKQEGRPTVAFRIEEKHFEKLVSRGNRAGTSAHLEAQAIVESVLDGGEDEALLMRGEVAALRGEVGTLRGEVGTLRGELEAIRVGLVTMFSLLVQEMSKGKTTMETARAQIERVFARKDGR